MLLVISTFVILFGTLVYGAGLVFSKSPSGLFGKRPKMRWFVSGVGALLLSSGAYFLWCFADPYITRPQLLVRSYFWKKSAFDVQQWKDHSPHNANASIEEQDRRGGMLFDFLCFHRLIGMSRQEVVKLLGEPDWDDRGGYGLGCHTWIDPDILYVDYDAAGRVRDYWTEQH